MAAKKVATHAETQLEVQTEPKPVILPEVKAEAPAKTFGKKQILLGVVIPLLAVAAAGGGTSYYFYSKFTDLKRDPQAVAAEEAREMIQKVGKLIALPANEEPTVATVSDPQQLQDQPFFANAKQGFKVLIYSKAGKAILYDPFENKLIEVAPINLGATAGAETEQ